MERFQILPKDYEDIRHPENRNKIVRLYRIIALRTFENKTFGTVTAGTIGGFVAGEHNLCHDDNAWIINRGLVFDDAVIRGDTLVRDRGAVYGNAELDGACVVNTFARVYGNVKANDCLFSGESNTYGNAVLTKSQIHNACKIYGDASLSLSIVKDGSQVHGNACVHMCEIWSVADVRGSTDLFNCQVHGRIVLNEGEYTNQDLVEDIILNIEKGSTPLSEL